jgi:ParB family transcriptional regulator, chromosome partitioning protein
VSKKALGRGIDALFQDGERDRPRNDGAGLMEVALSRLKPNPDQPRRDFDQASLEELAESIRQRGVIQPVLAEPGNGDELTIIAGERRYRASQLAGLSTIPVIVRTLSEEEKLEVALIENVQREDLNPIEEATAYRTLIDRTSLSQEDVASRVGKNRSTVANSLRLLKLPQDMQSAIAGGEMGAGHARAILSVVNPADQRILFNRIRQDGLSVRQAEEQAYELNRGIRGSADKPEPRPKPRNPEVTQIEQRLIEALGTKVSVRGTPRKGRIEISYFSMDDLERIYELLAPDKPLS